MAIGGQTQAAGAAAGTGGGGLLNFIASAWPALNRSLQTNEGMRQENIQRAQQNQARSMELGQQADQMTQIANIAGGYDPSAQTGQGQSPGITWNTGSADPSKNPLADVSRETTGSANGAGSMMGQFLSDPLAQTVFRLDPRGTLSSIVSRTFAPPENYLLTGPDGTTKNAYLTMPQAVKYQQQGYQVAKAEPAKSLDINTPLQTITAPGAGGRQQTFVRQPGTTNLTPFGGPGDFTIPAPAGDLGGILGAQRFMGINGGLRPGATLGGGASLGGGSGAPGGNAPNAPPQITSGAGGPISAPGTQPLTAATSQPTGAGQNAVPGMADIINSKMTAAARLPEQQAALNKSAEIQAGETTNKPIEAAKAEGAFNNHIIELNNLRTNAMAALKAPSLDKNFGKWSYVPNIRGGQAADAEAKLDTVRNQSILNVMQSARDMSQTGASGIRLMQSELPIFQNALGNLSETQDAGTAREQLQKIIDFTNTAEGTVRQEFQRTYGRDLQFPSSESSSPQSSATASVPPGAIQYLKMNPSMRAQFEQKYGAGSAKAALGY